MEEIFVKDFSNVLFMIQNFRIPGVSFQEHLLMADSDKNVCIK